MDWRYSESLEKSKLNSFRCISGLVLNDIQKRKGYPDN